MESIKPKMFCPECSKYSTCKKVCPEVESYVSQDYKGFNGKREVLVEHDKLPFLYSYMDKLGMYNDVFFHSGISVEVSECSLDVLTKSQKFVLYEFYWNGRSHREIAGLLGVKHQAVTEHLRAGRKALAYSLMQGKLPIVKEGE